MRKWLSYDSPLITVLNAMADMMLINIAFLICCLPVFTIGAANTALYAVGFRWAKKEEAGLKYFFKSFLSNFKTSLLPCLINVGITAVIILAISAVWTTDMPLGNVVKVILNVILFIFLMLTAQIFPFHSKFSCTTSQLYRNSLFTALSHPLRTIVLVVMQAIPFALFFLLPNEFTMFGFLWILFYFSLMAVVCCFVMKKPYAKYEETFEAQLAEASGDTAAEEAEIPAAALPTADENDGGSDVSE